MQSREEYVKCGKPFCVWEHGPYYYAYWRDSSTKKLNKKYIGNYFHKEGANIQNSQQKIVKDLTPDKRQFLFL